MFFHFSALVTLSLHYPIETRKMSHISKKSYQWLVRDRGASNFESNGESVINEIVKIHSSFKEEKIDHELCESIEKSLSFSLQDILCNLSHIFCKVCKGMKEHEEVSFGLLYVILTDPSNAAKVYIHVFLPSLLIYTICIPGIIFLSRVSLF